MNIYIYITNIIYISLLKFKNMRIYIYFNRYILIFLNICKYNYIYIYVLLLGEIEKGSTLDWDVKSDPCRFRPVPALAPMVAEVDRGAWDNGRKYENMKYPSTFWSFNDIPSTIRLFLSTFWSRVLCFGTKATPIPQRIIFWQHLQTSIATSCCQDPSTVMTTPTI